MQLPKKLQPACRRVPSRSFVLLAAALALGLCWLAPLAAAERVQLNTALGETFPDMEFDDLLQPEDYGNLGLEQSDGRFRLSAVPGKLLVLEFFSQYCLTCQRQGPYLDSFFQVVQQGDLKGQVRVLTVAVGSRNKDLQGFRRELKLTYPITADPFFERLMELGDPGGTPFTVFLLRRDQEWVLADFHLGFQGDTELLARSRVLVEGKAELVAKAEDAEGRSYHPPLGLTKLQQEKLAREFLGQLADGETKVDKVVTVDLSGRGRVFQALDADGAPTGMYARIASRDPVCDVCHAVHFMFAFDKTGTVLGFRTIHVTKFGNEAWSDEDAARMDGLLRGKKLGGLVFDREVDAVTSATMSSALIFDAVRRSADLPRLLSEL